MNIKYVARNYKPSDGFKEILEKKLEKFEKYFNEDAEVKINLHQQANMYKLEVTISVKGSFFRSEVISDNMYNNIDLALPKIERQLIKHGSKFATKLKKDAFVSPDLLFLSEKPEVNSATKVVKTKKFELVPTTIEDAEAQMEALGHNFYVFLNALNNKVSIVYKRNDNNNGLIEVEF